MYSSIASLLLFSFFTFSSARTLFHSTHNIDIHDDNIHPHSFPISLNNPVEPNGMILLPNDKSDPKPLTQVHWEQKTVPSKTSEPRPEETIESIEVPMDTTEVTNPLPFTIFSFRPMDPRVPRRPSPLSFHPHHHCHHGNKNLYYKPWKPHFPHLHRRNRVVPNNNVEDHKDVIDPVAHGQVRRPQRMRYGRIEPMFSRERRMAIMERRQLLRRLYHRFHRRQEPTEIKGTGLIKRIRKFLNRF